MPYSHDDMRSIYHIREYNFRRLALVRLSYLVAVYWRLIMQRIAFEATYLPLTRLAGIYRTPWQPEGSTTTEAVLQE